MNRWEQNSWRAEDGQPVDVPPRLETVFAGLDYEPLTTKDGWSMGTLMVGTTTVWAVEAVQN
jgi:hypothetical protein